MGINFRNVLTCFKRNPFYTIILDKLMLLPQGLEIALGVQKKNLDK